jgi:pyruvate/2-oxoglutarate/acetoin dehydrogenase E1 component
MNFVEALREGHLQQLKTSEVSYIIGLGVNYANGADGSTKGLAELYPDRVLDVPVSELSFTGMAVGMASQGLRPIVHHGRIEFAMLAFDQIFTQASRWDYMFGGDYPCPLFLRICIGRQWGNGPQHTANYHSIFMQATGLDIFLPATPEDAYRGLIYSSMIDRPSVMLEHRWLYKTAQEFDVETKIEASKLEVASVYGEGDDFTLLTYGDGLVECLKFIDFSREKYGYNGKVICLKYFAANKRYSDDLIKTILECKNVLAVDTAPFEGGILASFIGYAVTHNKHEKINIEKCSPPHHPCPTSPALVGEYYPNVKSIAAGLSNFGFKFDDLPELIFDDLHVLPSFDYSGYKYTNIY